MRDYDKEPLILENKFGKHMFSIAKFEVFFTILIACVILYKIFIQNDYDVKFFSLILIILFASKDYDKAYPIRKTKIIFYNNKMEIFNEENEILKYLQLNRITNIEVKSGITAYLRRNNITEKERIQTIIFVLFVFVYLPTFLAIDKYPIYGIFLLCFFTSYLILRTFGIRVLDNLKNSKTLVIHNNEFLEPIQLPFLDKNEQVKLKEFFMKRCKKIINF